MARDFSSYFLGTYTQTLVQGHFLDLPYPLSHLAPLPVFGAGLASIHNHRQLLLRADPCDGRDRPCLGAPRLLQISPFMRSCSISPRPRGTRNHCQDPYDLLVALFTDIDYFTRLERIHAVHGHFYSDAVSRLPSLTHLHIENCKLGDLEWFDTTPNLKVSSFVFKDDRAAPAPYHQEQWMRDTDPR
ncbi:hypothetical protein C8R44DRAFT_895958 [Mycena epipterygia]|nr:hypothetical protein C8R44DRAFT_895958 [Mycena epipterygia]